MHPRVFSFRIGLSLTICTALLVMPGGLLRAGDAAQGQREERRARPKPGKPEGEWPDLEDVKQESWLEREAPPAIPSIIRSRKNPLQPWNGRRVGDPETGSGLDQAVRTERGSAGSISHHARTRTTPPTILDDQFVLNFFNWTLLRVPNASETTFWNDQLRVAYAQGQTSLKLASIALGKTLFESAEYAARNRDNHWYVHDLYKTYLMRDPDAGGWAFWESQVPANGRENVRRAFEDSGEFAAIVASIVPNGSATSNAASLLSARVDPRNQPATACWRATRAGVCRC